MTYLSGYELRKSSLLLLTFSLLVIFLSTAGSSLVAGNGLSLSPSSGLPGAPITVSGSGFSSQDNRGIITLEHYPSSGPPAGVGDCAINAGTLTTSIGYPGMTCGFYVPSFAPGPYIVTVTGNMAQDGETAQFTILGSSPPPSTPSIQLSPNMGAAGTSVTVLGSGFSSADTSCTIASNIVEGGYTCNMNNAGDVSGSFIVNGPPGTYNIEVIGSTGDSANAPFTITSSSSGPPPGQPSIQLTPNMGPAGIPVTFQGISFPSVMIVMHCEITSSAIGGVTLIAAVPAPTCVFNGGNGMGSGGGKVGGSFTVASNAPPGPYTVTVTADNDFATASFTVTSSSSGPPPGQPSIQLSPNMGAAGTSVTVLGSGFSSADTSCTIASNIVEGGYTCNMNNAGDVSGSFIVNGPPGTYNIEVIGSTGDSANVPFTFTSTQEVTTSTQPAPDFTINVSPPSQWVLQGQAVLYSVNVVALNGFNSQVSLSVSGLPSGANGVFSNPFGTPNFVSALTVTMPSDASTGTYALTVTGNGGGLTHVANIVLTVNAATAPSTTSTTVPQTTGQVDWPPLLVAIVLLAAVLVWVALRRRREPTPTSTQPTKADRTTGMVYCGKCGTQNPAANDFCRKCGTKLN